MQSLTPTLLWISSVHYLEKHRAIAVEFSNSSMKRKKRFKFYPSMLLHKRVSLQQLKSIIALYDKKRFEIEERKSTFKITASTFSDLKCLSNLLSTTLDIKPLLIEPERQFLLGKNWSYFDCFTLDSRITKIESSMPDVLLPQLSESLPETLQQLLQHDKQGASMLLDSIVLSNLLAVPLHKMPHKSFVAETFLGNLFWLNGFPAAAIHTMQRRKEYSSIKPRDFVEFDFSALFPELLTQPFYNLGPDSINCSCCKPKDINAKNLLPNSLVNVEFTHHGFFYDSALPPFSRQFHNSHDYKESRERRRMEYGLQNYPIGPFRKGSIFAIPLVDALELQSRHEAKIISATKLSWFCTLQESFISRHINRLNKRISVFDRKLSALEQNAAKEHNLLANKQLQLNKDYLFLKTMWEKQSLLLQSLPQQLVNPSSCFYSKKLARAIETVKAGTLHKFKQFSSLKKAKVIQGTETKAYVKSDAPLRLLQEFNQQQQYPEFSASISF